MNNKNDRVKNTMPYLILFLVVAFVLIVLHFQGNTVKELTTGELLKKLENNEVTEIVVTPNNGESVYYIEGKLKDYKSNESFKAKIIEEDVTIVTNYVQENDIAKYNTNSDPGSSTFLYVLVNVLPFVITIVLAYVLFKKLCAYYSTINTFN